jgi:hypothetical protein
LEANVTGWLLSKTDTGFAVFKEIGDTRFSYPFQTEEWARLCQKSLDSHDEFLERRKWGGSMGTLITGYQSRLTGSTSLILSHLQLEDKPIIVWDHNRQVVKLDVPEIIRVWIKTTLLAKAYKRLMWGTKGKA